MAKDLIGTTGTPPAVPMRRYKGQVQFADGTVANVDCQAIDHVTAMIKLAATICDNPVPALAWIMKDETSAIIQPFAPAILPK